LLVLLLSLRVWLLLDNNTALVVGSVVEDDAMDASDDAPNPLFARDLSIISFVQYVKDSGPGEASFFCSEKQSVITIIPTNGPPLEIGHLCPSTMGVVVHCFQ
jgi:hypothetical protein